MTPLGDAQAFRAVRLPDALHALWWRRLARRAWLRGVVLSRVERDHGACRVVCLRWWRDALAARPSWVLRLRRCVEARVALRSLRSELATSVRRLRAERRAAHAR